MIEVALLETIVQAQPIDTKSQKNFQDYMDAIRHSMDLINVYNNVLLTHNSHLSNEATAAVLHIGNNMIYIYTTLHDQCKLASYREKNHISKTIHFSFDETLSLFHFLKQTVDAMYYAYTHFSSHKTLNPEFEKMYAELAAFTLHGHYLLNMPKTKDVHSIRDCILHIRHAYKTARKVQEYIIDTMIKIAPYDESLD